MDYYSCMHDTRAVSPEHPIKAALKRRWPPMTQTRLAQELRMNPSVLGLYLKGTRIPPEGFYTAAAAILGCDPDELKPTEGVAA
jgi:hypothetical protein